MKVKKIFKGFISNSFENPILEPINNSDANYLELVVSYNDVGGVILNSTNAELLENMVIVDFRGFTDGSPSKSFSINAKDSLPNNININFYQNGSVSDDICNREYIEVSLLQEVEDYTPFELSKIAHVQSILYGSGSDKLIALANEVGAPPPRPR